MFVPGRNRTSFFKRRNLVHKPGQEIKTQAFKAIRLTLAAMSFKNNRDIGKTPNLGRATM